MTTPAAGHPPGIRGDAPGSPRERVRRWIDRLADLGDSPERTAAAFAIGVFLSFSPFLGFQIALGLGAALAFRLHRLAILVGLCANLPMIMVPWYAVTTAVAAALLGSEALDVSDRLRTVLAVPVYRAEFWTRSLELLSPFFWAFLIGSTAGALLLGAIAYYASLRALAPLAASRDSA